MKYLDENMTATEAKAKYRALAKTMHPDVGGDEEEFKILVNEYVMLQKTTEVYPEWDVQTTLEEIGKHVDVIVQTLTELYPRTGVMLCYGFTTLTVDFAGNPSIQRMLEIVNVINQFPHNLCITVTFRRPGRKSDITMTPTSDSVVWINMRPVAGESEMKLPSAPTWQGRRYTVWTGTQYEKCVDSKLGRTYYMRKTPKFPLRTLLGID